MLKNRVRKHKELLNFFLQWLEKIGAVHLIKSFDHEVRKYLELSRIKYLIFLKCRTKYQKSETEY